MDKVTVHKITFFDKNKAALFVTKSKAEKILKLLEKKDGTQNYITVYDRTLHLSGIDEIAPVVMEFSDLSNECQKDYLAENPQALSSGEEHLGENVGLVVRWFKSDGSEIVSNPVYVNRTKPYNQKPDDFVEIEQNRYKKWLPDQNGEYVETYALGKPRKEIYYRWVWAGGYWEAIVCLVIQNGIISPKADRQPRDWNFVQEFQQNRMI